MVQGMVATVIKELRIGVCYNGFYSSLCTMLRNHHKFRGSTMVKQLEMGSPLGAEAIMVSREVPVFPT